MTGRESLKQRIRAGEAVKVVWAALDASERQVEEILGRDTYDLLYVDAQHAAFSEARLVAICRAAEGLGVPVQLRIKHPRQAYLIGNYLDLGPLAIKVPQVEDESTVVEALAAFYYPSVGKRSWGGDGRHGIKGRKDRLEYAQWWNENGILGIKIESVKAVLDVRKLAKQGVDYVDFGPADLQFDLEVYPDAPFKSVQDCVQYVAGELKGTGVRVM